MFSLTYEVSENTIYLINKEAFSTICIESGKKNYEPHETFCMGIADSSESTIEMDITEGATLEALVQMLLVELQSERQDQ